MFARRNLRRNLVIAVCCPIVLLCVFVIHQNHDVVFPQHSSQRQDVSYLLQEFNKVYSTRSKRSTSHSKLLGVHFNQELPTTSMIVNNPQTYPFPNIYNSNNNQPRQYQSFQQIIYPVYDTKNLERFVHLDLKGAAPIVDYYEKLFPFLRQLGATGLLIEYEDMFPFTDHLSIIKHGLAYTQTDIQRILTLAKMNGLKVMPLLQVYGHLEYVLKLKEFMHLREDSRYPQVITPCLEESYTLIFGKCRGIFNLIDYDLFSYD
jgi:hexosaminidase